MSILIDLESYTLTQEERELLQHPVCAGVILFARNYQYPGQLRQLTADIRKMRPEALIAVDQEGGSVQRFRAGFTELPPMSHWGKFYEQEPQLCRQRLTNTIEILAEELCDVGVNLDLIPVLDLNRGISKVIGERSLHHQPDIVITLGHIVIDALHRCGLPAVGKHFPGHGAVTVDSHQALPMDLRDWAMIWHQDMQPFVQLIGDLDAIMPAHIVFPALDSQPVTFSPFWLQEILRHQLNFQGVIISDDLTMAAAASQGDYASRATAAFQAGCDLLLVCNNRSGAIAALDSLLAYDRSAATERIMKFLTAKNSAML